MEKLYGLFFLHIFATIFVDGSLERLPDNEPSFSQPITNITAPLGRDAILSCHVENLETFKVGWMRAEDQTVLALQMRVVTQNSRYTVIHEQMNVWRLKIHNVREGDRGCYMCQINTTPLKKQIGCIDVHSPPDILDNESSSDIQVNEGQEALLYCNAVGHPQPRITWRRDDGNPIIIRSNQSNSVERRKETFIGNILTLYNISRKQMGAYLCIAANDVPPAVSKRVYLSVQFPPNATVQKNLMGAYEGQDAKIECVVESFPRPVSYWMKETTSKNYYHQSDKPRIKMLQQSKKYHIVEHFISSYKLKMQLTIIDFNELDSGSYSCISSNNMGRANMTIKIFEVKIPTTMRTTTTTTTERTTVKVTRLPTTPSTSTVQPSSTSTSTEFQFEYITYTQGLIDGHFAGESYLNQPNFNVAYSKNTAAATKSPFSIGYIVAIISPLLLKPLCR